MQKGGAVCTVAITVGLEATHPGLKSQPHDTEAGLLRACVCVHAGDGKWVLRMKTFVADGYFPGTFRREGGL